MEQETTQNKSNKQLVTQLASLLHEEWRRPKLRDGGTFKPRFKKTTDEEWITQNNSTKVDITGTNYDDLPEDWQKESKASAEVTLEEITKSYSI